MTDNEQRQVADTIRRFDGDKVRQLTDEEKKLSKELQCRSMINSIICYGGFGKTAEKILEDEEKAYHNYLADDIRALGRNRVLELIQEQLDDIVDIKRNVYTDHEGCTYNSIVWKDEI